MPRMMDTILNLGLNDEAAQGLARTTGNRRFARDAYRRLVQMYGNVVDSVDADAFEQELSALKEEQGAAQDVDLSPEDLIELVERFKRVYRDATKRGRTSAGPEEQLRRAVRAVFRLVGQPARAGIPPRQRHPRRPRHCGDVVRVVFGNKGGDSGTGVAFTRDPATGEQGIWGEFLTNAQGEDVVGDIRTPQPIAEMKAALPEAYDQLVETMQRLEEHYREMQDIEFTVIGEDGSTCRHGAASEPRRPRFIAVEMVDEGLITKDEAVARIDPSQLDQLLHPMIDPQAHYEAAAEGAQRLTGGGDEEDHPRRRQQRNVGWQVKRSSS